jgi:hypothetical protein
VFHLNNNTHEFEITDKKEIEIFFIHEVYLYPGRSIFYADISGKPPKS